MLTAFCANCGAEIPTSDSGVEPRQRLPCTACGSTSRRFGEALTATCDVHAGHRMKHVQPGLRRPLYELTSWLDFNRDTSKPRHRAQIIDRSKDIYVEVITDPHSHDVFRSIREPLSCHVSGDPGTVPRSLPECEQGVRPVPLGDDLARVMYDLPPPVATSAPVVIEIDGGDWGPYRATFVAKKRLNEGRESWFWTMDRGERSK